MKLKRKRKRGYKKYLIGFFILTLLYAGFKVYNRFFDENKPQLSEPNKADKKIKVEKNEDDEIDLESVPKKGPYNEPDMDQIIKSKKSSHNKESTLINKEKIQKQEKTESNTNKISVLINEIKKLIEEQKKFKDNEQYKNLLKVNEFIEKKKLNQIDYDSLEEKVRPKINTFEDFISKENENSKNIRDKEEVKKIMFPDLGSQYKFVKEIGRGGSGVVYLALDRHSGFLVCVKKLLDEHSNNDEFLIKFKSEANIYLMLNHPNIVSLKDFIVKNNSFYLVQEYVEGQKSPRIYSKRNGTHSFRSDNWNA